MEVNENLHPMEYSAPLTSTLEVPSSFGSGVGYLDTAIPVRSPARAPKQNSFDASIVHGNALDVMKSMASESVHLIATDPPYFIDGMGSDWNRTELKTRADRATVVGSLPVGMKFDPAQGRAFQEFMEPISREAMRILKPGGFFIAFSQARLYHRLAVAAEDAGFEIRDMLAWNYEGQAKAFSMDHFIRKMKLNEREKQVLLDLIGGRKTPQLKPQMEPMVMAQKPRVGTFVENYKQFQVGLVDTSASLDGRFPGNVMTVAKPSKEEKGPGNEHLTVKPVRIMEHLIQLFSAPGQVVLDPFLGSGTTGVAAVNMGRQFRGIEIDREYAQIASKRIKAARVRNAG